MILKCSNGTSASAASGVSGCTIIARRSMSPSAFQSALSSNSLQTFPSHMASQLLWEGEVKMLRFTCSRPGWLRQSRYGGDSKSSS